MVEVCEESADVGVELRVEAAAAHGVGQPCDPGQPVDGRRPRRPVIRERRIGMDAPAGHRFERLPRRIRPQLCRRARAGCHDDDLR